MKVFSAAQIRKWDEFTITHEPIPSIDLMERAAQVCVKEIITLCPSTSQFIILSGPGNNGGDGLAIARLLKEKGLNVVLHHPGRDKISADNQTNLDRWEDRYGKALPLGHFDPSGTGKEHVLIDALFGTGQSRPPAGIYRELVNRINAAAAEVVAIDMPSGMIADAPSDTTAIVRATHTFTFQLMKLAFLLPSTGPFCGNTHILDIGLSREYYDRTEALYEITDGVDVRELLKPRQKFSHKGDFGTALLMAGKQGMMGAAILASRAAFRSGLGKLVCRIPAASLDIMQTAVPEAICSTDPDPDHLTTLPDLAGFDAIAIGPGIGTNPDTAKMLHDLLSRSEQPTLLDADALNIIAAKGWQPMLRKNMVITPHPGEFRRLFGEFSNDFDRLEACADLSTSQEICIILKGHYTYLSTESGKRYFNPTGNPGMAKAGSGDVMSGILAAFLAQGYSIGAASRLAVYVHGMAGDLAAKTVGEPGLMPSDTIDFAGMAIERIWQIV